MKIERVSENQLKLTLTRADLMERDLNLEDLIAPSEKTQSLFRDIMEQVLSECNFISENTPLMVEACPAGTDGITLIVTKIDQKNKNENAKGVVYKNIETSRRKKNATSVSETTANDAENLLIFSFESLDDVTNASLRLENCYQGESCLFKNNQRFFLVLQPDLSTMEDHHVNIALILDEFGDKHVSTALAKAHLKEHGEIMIKENAVKTLINTFAN
ncbi:MAG: adaptor protein MecA [Anaerotignum sp.]